MTTPGILLACGTNSFRPLCHFYNITGSKYHLEKSKPGQALCPYGPKHNSTSVFVGKSLPSLYYHYLAASNDVKHKVRNRWVLRKIRLLFSPNPDEKQNCTSLESRKWSNNWCLSLNVHHWFFCSFSPFFRPRRCRVPLIGSHWPLYWKRKVPFCQIRYRFSRWSYGVSVCRWMDVDRNSWRTQREFKELALIRNLRQSDNYSVEWCSRETTKLFRSNSMRKLHLSTLRSLFQIWFSRVN